MGEEKLVWETCATKKNVAGGGWRVGFLVSRDCYQEPKNLLSTESEPQALGPSSHLRLLVAFKGLSYEATVCHITVYLRTFKWRWRGFNLGPSACQARPLPLGYNKLGTLPLSKTDTGSVWSETSTQVGSGSPLRPRQSGCRSWPSLPTGEAVPCQGCVESSPEPFPCQIYRAELHPFPRDRKLKGL